MSLNRDPLTQCETRTAFDARLEEAIRRTNAEYARFALIFLDIDHFKSINDAFGHIRGDRVLAEIARRLMSAARRADHVFRVGGDEFALIMTDASRDEARRTAERLLASIRGEPFPGDPPLTPSISIGVAVAPDDAVTADALYSIADQRHYRAKRAGHSKVVATDLPDTETALAPPTRLIERDTVLHAASTLFADLAVQRRGLLRLFGPIGSGWTRTLSELHTIAELLGYATLNLRGSPAVANRVNGALSRAVREIPALAQRIGTPPLAVVLRDWLEAEGRRGLLITIDDIGDIDAGSIELLGELIDDDQLPRLAIAATSTDGYSLIDRLERPLQARRTARLDPIGLEGLRAWLRQSLRCEAPAELLVFLAEHSGGLPGPFWRALSQLIAEGGLIRADHTWKLAPDYQATALGDVLDRRWNRPPLRIPAGLSEFVGRADEVTRLIELVSRERLVALVGPGGIGKTRLALQVAAEAGEQMPDGAQFVGLVEAATTDRVAPVIAEALGVAGASDLLGAIHALLRRKRMVLLLDNLEHLPGIEQIVRDLLDHTEMPHIIVTSRVRPALPNAQVVELNALDLPGGADQAALNGAEASNLFVRRARQASPSFLPGPQDSRYIAQICRMLGGMPLAIELAAGWTTTSGCREIADRIAANLGSLQSQDIGQQNVQAVVETFWGRLSAAEQAMLRRLGLFRGAFHEAAAGAIAGASPFFLGALVVSGYLRRMPDGCFEIHELLRQYALSHLMRAPHDHRTTLARFADYYANLVVDSGPALDSGGEALQPLRREMANILAAWDWIVGQGRIDLIARIAPGMARYWEVVGQLHIGAQYIDAAIDRLRTHLHVSQTPSSDYALLAHLLCRRAWAMLLSPESFLSVADPLISEAEHAAAIAEDEAALKECLVIRGADSCYRDPVRGAELLARAYDLPGSMRSHGECLRFQGITCLFQGDLKQAGQHYHKAFACFSAAGDRLGVGRTLVNLVFYAIAREQFSAAQDQAGQLLSTARAMGSSELEIVALLQMAEIDLLICAYGQAQRTTDQALRLSRETGDRDLALWASRLDCTRIYATAPPEQAIRRCTTAIAECEQAGAASDEAMIRSMLADALCAEGQFAEAADQYRLALGVLANFSDPTMQAHTRAGMASATLALGLLQEAQTHADTLLERLNADVGRIAEPFRVCQAIYDVLSATADPRADQPAQTAQATLERRCTGINDPAARERYRATMSARWPILTTATAVL